MVRTRIVLDTTIATPETIGGFDYSVSFTLCARVVELSDSFCECLSNLVSINPSHLHSRFRRSNPLPPRSSARELWKLGLPATGGRHVGLRDGRSLPC